jgi:NAD-dependent deacetylase
LLYCSMKWVNDMEGIKALAALFQNAKHAVFFGGAGVSTESRIPDFRSADGLYHQAGRIPPESILSHSFFERHPEAFFSFYREKVLAPAGMPNAAHTVLAELEKRGWLACVITQNIDGLHQKAGSRRVLELHGSSLRNYCLDCGAKYPLEAVLSGHPLPKCACGGLIRPDVVLYREDLDEEVVQGAMREIRLCDLPIIGGTSLTVNPAADYASLCPGKLVIINREVTPLDARADIVIREPIGKVFTQVMALMDET